MKAAFEKLILLFPEVCPALLNVVETGALCGKGNDWAGEERTRLPDQADRVQTCLKQPAALLPRKMVGCPHHGCRGEGTCLITKALLWWCMSKVTSSEDNCRKDHKGARAGEEPRSWQPAGLRQC